MLRKPSREDHDVMLETLERQGRNLTTWEEGFIESLRAHFHAGRELTDRQVETLERIYAQRTP